MFKESFISFLGLFPEPPFCEVLLIPSKLFRDEDRWWFYKRFECLELDWAAPEIFLA